MLDRMLKAWLSGAVMTGATALSSWGTGAELLDDFELVTVVPSVPNAVAIAFAPDGRLFVASAHGIVDVWRDGVQQAEPFIDLQDEVQGPHGLFSVALDPDFVNNRHVYLMYVVDPIFGPPDEPDSDGSHSRVTRYTGTLASNGNVADPASRTVLIGATPDEGPTMCLGHAGGEICFGADGSLLVSFGDGATPLAADGGGLQPDCFPPNDPYHDVGAFRAQDPLSLAGKVIRVDPATGLGLATNPFFTGDATDVQSKIWVSGCRQPFRNALRPIAAEGPTSPGALYLCDVGWDTFEEITVVFGGENCGWPCHEGPSVTPLFPGMTPAHSGCDTIETKVNPGPLTGPAVVIHHADDTLSNPAGHLSEALTGAAFYTAPYYPDEYLGRLFLCDFDLGWIKVAEFDDQHQPTSMVDFGIVDRPLDLTTHPLNGDVYFIDRTHFRVDRVRYVGNIAGDTTGDGTVDVEDLLFFLGGWGPCWGCPQDIDGDGAVDTADLLAMLGNWGMSE